MELCIHFNTLPEGMSLDDVKSDLAVLLAVSYTHLTLPTIA